jgi:hypothetical protein
VALCEPLVEAVAEAEGEDLHVAALADAVDTADTLNHAEWVPGGVVVHDDVAELKVDAFATGFGGKKEAAIWFFAEATDDLFSRVGTHASHDNANRAWCVQALQAVFEEGDGASVFGEDEELLSGLGGRDFLNQFAKLKPLSFAGSSELD